MPVSAASCCLNQRSKGSCEAMKAPRLAFRSGPATWMIKASPAGVCCRYQFSVGMPMRRPEAPWASARGLTHIAQSLAQLMAHASGQGRLRRLAADRISELERSEAAYGAALERQV